MSTSSDPWWAPIWARHGHRYTTPASTPPAGEGALRRELLFCLLGGHGVTYELARSATTVIRRLRPFDSAWTHARLRCALQRELAKPQFEPPRQDGTLRRYRYPARKSWLIADAVIWVRTQGGLRNALAARATEVERRSWLCECPGVGLKTASWILRNCNWARNLAILDVHLLRALREAQIIGAPNLPRDYELVEHAYLRWAEQLGACPAALDNFLWDIQRARSA
jgi:N-glycosylase/DNA lyase